jgi:hypothetical protein
MGPTYVDATVSGPAGARHVRFLVVTLEDLGLVFHPFNRTLRPARMPLA